MAGSVESRVPVLFGISVQPSAFAFQLFISLKHSLIIMMLLCWFLFLFLILSAWTQASSQSLDEVRGREAFISRVSR